MANKCTAQKVSPARQTVGLMKSRRDVCQIASSKPAQFHRPDLKGRYATSARSARALETARAICHVRSPQLRTAALPSRSAARSAAALNLRPSSQKSRRSCSCLPMKSDPSVTSAVTAQPTPLSCPSSKASTRSRRRTKPTRSCKRGASLCEGAGVPLRTSMGAAPPGVASSWRELPRGTGSEVSTFRRKSCTRRSRPRS
mmetsp:Transcript_40332/g.116486  ORF Transcript_40332/g.116486 Transcript_40332/m.116486 type:complete len:200 (-) Transcript_40332:132-731(-)